jgi:PAT family beta-lactamase induction signal transducer AmpG
MPRSAADRPHDTNTREVLYGVVEAFRTFFGKVPTREMLFALLFLLFYRFPEALLTKMSVTFLMRPHSAGGLGLSPQEFGLASGTVGVIGLTLGGIIGGLLAGRDGFKRWLWPMVCAITLPDIVYVYMSYAMPENLVLISSCLFIEQFGYGLGFTALTLYMLYFSKGSFQTSHYAFCTAISYLGLMLPGMLSGYLKDIMGYQSFFVMVMALCAITFLVTAFIKVDPDFGKKMESAD